jgi:hypothetical protein
VGDEKKKKDELVDVSKHMKEQIKSIRFKRRLTLPLSFLKLQKRRREEATTLPLGFLSHPKQTKKKLKT